MSAIRDILVLDGYGAYVWPAFATWASVMGWMAVSTLRWLRISEATLDKLQAARGARRSAGKSTAGQEEAGT